MSTNITRHTGNEVLPTPATLGLMEGICISHSAPFLGTLPTTVGYAVDELRQLARSDV